MNICLFSQDEINKPLSLKDERGAHIVKILHKKAGDTFVAGIIDGDSGVCTIKEISDSEIFFSFKATGDGKPLFPVKMIIGFPRPIQLKRLLRDVAALGVSEVHLTGTELGEKSYLKSNVVENGSAEKMLLDGTVQAGGTKVPKLFVHNRLCDCLDAVSCVKSEKGFEKNQLLISLDNIRPSGSLTDVLRNHILAGTEIVAAIGGERGWTDKERELFDKKGYVLCGMGNRIMRTETAATVAGAIILNEMGVLN